MKHSKTVSKFTLLRNTHKNIYGSLPLNTNKSYSSGLKYIQDIFGEHSIQKTPTHKLSTLHKSKTVLFRNSTNIPICNKQNNITTNKPTSHLKEQTMQHKTKPNKITIPKLDLNAIDNRTIRKVYNTDKQDQMKHMNPTGYNWLTVNIELSFKSHIYKSKDNVGNLSYRKPPNFNKLISIHSITQNYYEKVKKKISESE